MLGINRRPSFSLKNIYLFNLWYLAVLETLNTHGGIIEFSWQYNFSGKTTFLIVSDFFSQYKGMVYFKWKLTPLKTTEYLSISWVTQRRLSFAPLVWSCFWHVLAFSGLLWLVTGCSTFNKRQSRRIFWRPNLLQINFYKGGQVLL